MFRSGVGPNFSLFSDSPVVLFDSPVRQVTPLRPLVFERELVGYPSSKLRYILDGIRFGFRTGWSADRVSLRSRSANLKSALEHPQVVDTYISAELEAGRVAGAFIAPPVPWLHCSPFGVIPKNHQPGKWRLILDLSAPPDHSVKTGILKDAFSLHRSIKRFAI